MKKIFIIHHTHWDYEWYFTKQESEIQLQYHIREIFKGVKDGSIKKYLLDGQTSLIETFANFNYKKIKDYKKIFKDGEIIVGPWYTQSDQFLVSIESIYQNLNIGISDAKQLGIKNKVAYVPDSFGQNPEIIDVYKHFKLDTLVFWRGLDPKKTNNVCFKWKNENNSIDTLNIRHGYYYGSILYDEKYLFDYIKEYEETFPNQNIIIPAGGDQRAPDCDIEKIISKFNEKSKEYKMELVSYEKLKNEYQIKDNINGEMLNGAYSKIHRSIYSTRNDIKKLNYEVQNLIIKQTTPLMIMADEIGIEYEGSLLENIWRDILKCHAHDSVTGCNSDITNKHIKDRLIKIKEQLLSLNDYLIRKVSEGSLKNNEILLLNTLGFDREVEQEILINTKLKNFKLVDMENQEVEFSIINREKFNSGSIGEKSKKELDYYQTKIKIRNEIEAYSFKKYKVEEVNYSLDKREYKYELKKTLLKDFYLTIEDDAGDNYDFSYSEKHEKLEIQLTSFNIKKNTLTKTINWKGEKLFIKITIDEKSGANKLSFEIDNKGASNFRIQLVSDVKLKKDSHNYMGISRVQQRNNIDPNLGNWENDNWKEMPSSIFPMLDGVEIANNKWIITNGIHEYEIYDKNVAVTLMRSVDALGKPNLIRRPGKASGQEFKYIESNDSKMLGVFTTDIYIVNSDKYSIRKKIDNLLNDLLYYQVQEYNRFTGPLKYFTSNKNEELNFNNSNLKEIKPNNKIDILGISKDKKGISLRILNDTDEPIHEYEKKIKPHEITVVRIEE